MPGDFSQSSSQFLVAIDGEIARLQDLRQQVAAAIETDTTTSQTVRPARKGMSAEGRRRVAEAQKARWAKQKKAAKAAKKTAAPKPAAKKRPGRKPSAKKTAAAK